MLIAAGRGVDIATIFFLCLIVLISGFGILMGGLMMEVGLMMVVVWVDDRG